MKNKFQLKSIWIYFALGNVVIVLFFLLSNTSFFRSINNLFTDRFHESNEVRNEIVIVEIDDESLQKIGAWPWDRSVFTRLNEQISKENPSVIGYDVLFLESRSGDESLQKFLNETNTKIVFGSKIVEDDVLKSVYEGEHVSHGFVNFNPDSDGKIRRSIVYKEINGQCENSLALEMFRKHLRVNSEECASNIKVRQNTINTQSGWVKFSYSRNAFKSVSVSDVLDGNFDEGTFENKLVLVGSTALDVRSNLNDNFTSIFGTTIPGIEIHANIVNSFLNNEFLHDTPLLTLFLIIAIISNILLALFYKVKNVWLDLVFLILTLLTSIFLSLILFDLNYIFNLVAALIIFISIFVFNIAFKFLVERREKQFITTLFNRYLNPNLLHKINENPDLIRLGGETREMTVLFSDIRSFTTISEKLKPEELVEMLNTYLNKMSSIIMDHNGTIDKFIGDAIMAFWNAPLDDSNHRENALKASLAMNEQLKEFNASHPNWPELHIGIGLNTGKMVVGNIGGEKRFDYTVLGDSVNLGSRLEGLTKKYGVTLIAAETTLTDKIGLEFRLLDEVKVKGKETAIKIYEPIKSITEEIKKYNLAFETYQKGEFEKSLEILKTNTSDPPSEKLLERITTLTSEQKKNWNGIWSWEEK